LSQAELSALQVRLWLLAQPQKRSARFVVQAEQAARM
jgi:hypothetical protein